MEMDQIKDIIDSLKNSGTSKERAIQIISGLTLNGDSPAAMNYLFQTYGRDDNISYSTNLELDESVWYGLFKEYRELVAETTEAPDVYHFFCFAQVLGNTLVRRIYVNQARILYPNFYTCLVGPTGIGRKDTAWHRGNTLLLRLHANEDNDNPKWQILPGIGSAEGLLDALNGQDKAVVMFESELLTLMSKAKQDGVSNIIPLLTSLYDCPDRATSKTRQNPVVAIRPFLSIASGSTPAWLQKSLTERDVMGGFANRFIFVLGKPKDPKPYPAEVNEKKLVELVRKINDMRKWATEISAGENKGNIFVPDETKDAFKEWYFPNYEKCKQDTLISNMFVRLQTFVWKFALLYAAQDGMAEITPEYLQKAISVVAFIEASTIELFRNFGASRGKAEENRLIEYPRNKGIPMKKRDIYRALNMSSTDLERMLPPLTKMGIISVTNDGLLKVI